jgi:hypothetical protein
LLALAATRRAQVKNRVKSSCERNALIAACPRFKMDIYDTSIMDPDPPRPAESSPQRPEDAAPPPPADDEDVSPTLGALKNVGGAALAGLGAVKNVAAGLAATVLDDLLEPEQSEGGALDDVLRRMSGDEDGDGSPPGGLLAHTRNEERRRREAEYKAAQERHARAARELAEAEKRRQQPDEVDGFVLVRDLANPTGADPPVPPPEYCVVSIAAD